MSKINRTFFKGSKTSIHVSESANKHVEKRREKREPPPDPYVKDLKDHNRSSRGAKWRAPILVPESRNVLEKSIGYLIPEKVVLKHIGGLLAKNEIVSDNNRSEVYSITPILQS